MAKLLTFTEAQSRFESIITTDIDIADAIQEAVDRIFEFGRHPGTTEEIELTAGMFEEDADGNYELSVDDEQYNGAIGFRNKNGGWSISDQETLYRTGINAGDKDFIDLETFEELDDGTGVVVRVRKYRAPHGFNPNYAGPYYALMKLEPPELLPDDYVPVESITGLKMAIQAICYENSGDDVRAEDFWRKFEVAMTRSKKQVDGPKKRRLGMDSSLRRKPKQFM